MPAITPGRTEPTDLGLFRPTGRRAARQSLVRTAGSRVPDVAGQA